METRQLELKNRHGKRMPATLRLPEGEPRGTFVMLPGLGGWKDQEIIASIAGGAASVGYAAVTFNNADNSESPDGDFFRSTNSGYLEDVEDVIETISDEPWFVPSLVLGGHSQGGAVAIRYASLHSDHLSHLVLTAPAVSWKMGALFWIPWVLPWFVSGKKMWPGPHGKRLLLGRQWIFDFLRFDGYRDARSITCPTLIVSAGKDQTVAKPREHRHFAFMLSNAKHVTVAGARHSFSGHGAEVAGIVKQWLTSS